MALYSLALNHYFSRDTDETWKEKKYSGTGEAQSVSERAQNTPFTTHNFTSKT